MGLNYEALRRALDDPPPRAGDWWIVPEGVIEWARHKNETAERRLLVAGEPRSGMVPFVCRTTTEYNEEVSAGNIAHPKHQPVDGHPPTCRIDMRGEIIPEVARRLSRVFDVHGVHSCREPDDDVIETVMRILDRQR